jgi:hypothetical protein
MINNCLLFDDVPPVCFGPYQPSSVRSLTKELYSFVSDLPEDALWGPKHEGQASPNTK